MKCSNHGFAGHWMMDQAESAKRAPVKFIQRRRRKVKHPSSKADLRRMAAGEAIAPKPQSEPTKDRYLINARYAGEDRTGQPVKRGDLIYYYPASREVELYLTVSQPAAKSKRHQRKASAFYERTLQG